ncbi:hypothetical protein PG2001B_1616 [Bifidobacterium pseudolongum subsp. globosum]|uniref:Glycosyltransferase RgtA/B/C/D-like domain-containing protein n=1 Tax=Bifidobacterium pseudolongum subsp. globosum TaxID=1690 RepID=A0A4Q5AS10_9BIFI|nr:hypothetical protein [Bifidobacterium pseudolongum]RYQ36987.1 hypothetical protein PG2001B_1616 [Bifidobacterium pseudolongum subsp. globosum]
MSRTASGTEGSTATIPQAHHQTAAHPDPAAGHQGAQHGARTICAAISRWLLTIAMGFEAAVVALLLVLSLIFTCVFKRRNDGVGSASVTELVNPHLGAPSFAFICGCVVLVAMLMLIVHGAARVKQRNTLLFLLAFVTIVQILWIAAVGLTTYDYPDSRSLIDGADALLTGDAARYSPDFCPSGTQSEVCLSRPHGVPSPHAYFSYYPFQTGPMLWYVFAGSIFGSHNIIAFQILNAFAVTGLVAALWRLGTLIGLDDAGHAALAALLATCVPLLMFATFVYPNAVGFSITIAGVALIAQAFRTQRAWQCVLALVGGFLVCGVGVILKSTFIILMLAAIIGIVLVVVANRKWWQGAVALVSFGGAYMLTKLPVRIIEHITHQDFGKGMPMLSWITLGLNEHEGTTPGWWTAIPLNTYHKTHGDYGQQAQVAQEFVMERIRHFVHDPGDAVDFFSMKLSSEWAEPTFMTSLYSQLGSSAHGFTGLPQWLLSGTGAARLTSYENIAQTVLYALALTGVIAMLVSVVRSAARPMEDAMMFARTFLCAAFLGGFLCYLFWEAKGIYTLPFYLLLFPLAAYGMQTIMRATHTGVARIRGRREQA